MLALGLRQVSPALALVIQQASLALGVREKAGSMNKLLTILVVAKRLPLLLDEAWSQIAAYTLEESWGASTTYLLAEEWS
jgi:hypothetical protein